MRSKAAGVFLVLGGALLVAAVALLAYNRWDDWRAWRAASAVESVISAHQEQASSSVLYGQEEDETLEVEGFEYIGSLSIPRFGLELPIMANWSYEGMKIAPGRYSGSAATGNLVICGHNYERHFGNLKSLEAGDTVVFTNLSGQAYTYEVIEVLTLQPTAVSEMVGQEDSQWDLTLFTCTSSGQARVTVRCSRTES